MNEEEIVKAAISLGKQALVVEWNQGCGYHGAQEDLKRARQEFERRKAAFLALINHERT